MRSISFNPVNLNINKTPANIYYYIKLIYFMHTIKISQFLPTGNF